MKNLLSLASVAEGFLGVILVVHPSIVVRLLIGSEIAGAGVIVSRFAGIALIGFGTACWPGPRPAFYGMLTYSALAMLYFVYIGVRGEFVGLLLWPAVVLHALLSALLVVALVKQPKSPAA